MFWKYFSNKQCLTTELLVDFFLIRSSDPNDTDGWWSQLFNWNKNHPANSRRRSIRCVKTLLRWRSHSLYEERTLLIPLQHHRTIDEERIRRRMNSLYYPTGKMYSPKTTREDFPGRDQERVCARAHQHQTLITGALSPPREGRDKKRRQKGVFAFSCLNSNDNVPLSSPFLKRYALKSERLPKKENL